MLKSSSCKIIGVRMPSTSSVILKVRLIPELRRTDSLALMQGIHVLLGWSPYLLWSHSMDLTAVLAPQPSQDPVGQTILCCRGIRGEQAPLGQKMVVPMPTVCADIYKGWNERLVKKTDETISSLYYIKIPMEYLDGRRNVKYRSVGPAGPSLLLGFRLN